MATRVDVIQDANARLDERRAEIRPQAGQEGSERELLDRVVAQARERTDGE